MCLLLVAALPFSADDTDTTESTITLQSGGLVFSSVPCMDFGTQTISSSNMSFSPADTTPYTVVVSDLRGSPTGWNVTAQLGQFNGAANSLPAADISISGGTVTGDDVSGVVAVSNITLSAGGTAQRVFYAPSGAGANQSTLTWPLANVKLNIPAGPGVTTGTHTANIAWTLTDGPGT